MIDHTNDRAYLATCRRLGIIPSHADYEEFLADRRAGYGECDSAATEFDD